MTLIKVLQYSIGPVGAAVLSLLTIPILAHFFNPEDVGRYSLLQVLLSLSTMLFSLGLHQSFVRDYFEYSDKPSLVLMAFLPCVIVLLIFFALYGFSPFSISKLVLDLDGEDYSFYILCLIFLSVLINQFAHVLRMKERALMFSFSTIFPRFNFIFLILVFLLLLDDYNFDVILKATLGSLLMTFIFFFFVLIELRQSFSSKIDIKHLIEMLKFGMPLILGGLAFWGIASVDRFLLKYYSSLSEVAIYSMAVSFASIGSILTSIFGTIWHPLVYRWSSEGLDKKRLQNVLDLALVVICCAWSAAGLFSWLINLVLPEYYSNVVYIMPLCLAVPLLYLLSEITQIGIGISRKTIYAMLISILALVVNISLNILLLESFGAIGAATASALAFALFLILRTEVSHYLMASYKRRDLYSIVSIYFLISILFAAIGDKSFYYHLIWLIPLPFVIARFKNELLSFRTGHSGL